MCCRVVEFIRFGDRVQVQTMLISLREKNSNIKIWKIIQDFKAETNEHSFYNLFVVLLTTKPPEMSVRIESNRLMCFCDIRSVFCTN